MSYDVLIVSAKADKAKAALLAKRLRALKFKVRHDAKREHTTPTSRDLTDANKSGSVLVLWSKSACDSGDPDSDWVHSMAHLARSRPGALVQADLDTTTPDDPFDKDERYRLAGMGPKRIPNGLFSLIEVLGDRDGRTDLKAWLQIDAGDKDGQEAWKAAHPGDPLAAAPKSKTKAKAGTKTKPKAAKPVVEAAAATPAVVSTAAAAEAKADPASGSKIKLNPPTTQLAYRRPHPATLHDEDEISVGWTMLGPILAGIAVMMLLAWGLRTEVTPGGPVTGIANATFTPLAACPAGQVPRSLIETRPLRTGPIVDDTEE